MSRTVSLLQLPRTPSAATASYEKSETRGRPSRGSVRTRDSLRGSSPSRARMNENSEFIGLLECKREATADVGLATLLNHVLGIVARSAKETISGDICPAM